MIILFLLGPGSFFFFFFDDEEEAAQLFTAVLFKRGQSQEQINELRAAGR